MDLIDKGLFSSSVQFGRLVDFDGRLQEASDSPAKAITKDLGRLYVLKCPAYQWKNGIAAL